MPPTTSPAPASRRARRGRAGVPRRPAGGRPRLEKPDLPPPPGGEPEALAEQAIAHRPDVAARGPCRAGPRHDVPRAGATLPRPRPGGGYKRTAGLDTAVVGLVATVPVFERTAARWPAPRPTPGPPTSSSRRRSPGRGPRPRSSCGPRAPCRRGSRASTRTWCGPRKKPAARRSRPSARAPRRLRVVDAERTNTDARKEALDLTVEAFLASGRARLAAGLEVLP